MLLIMHVHISSHPRMAACARAWLVGSALLLAWLAALGVARAQDPPFGPDAGPTDAGAGDASAQKDAGPADAGAGDARADGGAQKDASAASEEVVTASRTDEARKDGALATQLITRAQIEQTGARNAGELLAVLPALQVREDLRGTSLWLRGLDPQYTLILVDGERIPGRVDGAIDLSRFGVERIDRVEIVRGPSSALYGSDAIAGVVNLLPREARAPLQADALLSYGSRDTLDGTAFVAGEPHETVRLSGTGGYHQSDSFRLPGVPGTAGSARKQWSAGGTARFDPSAKHRLTVASDYTRLSLRGVDEAAGGAVLDRAQRAEQLSARLAQRYTPGPRFRWENRASYGQYRDRYQVDQRDASALDDSRENREQLFTFSSLLRTQRLAWWSSLVGIDFLAQRLRSPSLSTIGQRERVAVFGQHDFRIYRITQLVVGIRLDWDSQYGQQFSPKVALRFDPHETLVLRLSYGRGFQAPSFQQLYLRFEDPSAGAVVIGNPRLRAERSHGVDLSAEWTPSAWIALSVALFRNDLDAMIATVARPGEAAGVTYTYDNVSSAWTTGLESSLQMSAGKWLSFQGSYALTYGRDEERDRTLPGRARHRPTALLRLEHPAWKLSGLVRCSLELGRRFFLDEDGDGLDELRKAPPLWRADARIEQRVGQHLELFVGIDNLADSYDAFARLAPRTYYGGARGRY